MKKNPLKDGDVIINSAGVGTVTRSMVRKRAAEIAVINGRSADNILESDWQQAKRELTGGQEMDPLEARLEAAPESERWDPVPGSEGRKVQVNLNDDDDEEGRSDSEKLTEEGVAAAEHDQMLRATREAEQKDSREA